MKSIFLYIIRISSHISLIVGLSLLFTQAHSQTIDVAVSQVSTPTIGGTLRPDKSFVPRASFRNLGTTSLASVPVRFEIINVAGSTIYLSNKVISALSPSVESYVDFDACSSGLSAGTYTLRVSQLLSDDTIRTNDRITGAFFVNWRTTSQMSTQRRYHTSSLLSDGKVLVAGGDIPTFIQKSCEIFDPVVDSGRGTWRSTASMAVARAIHTATMLPNGRVLIVGGVNGYFQRERTCEVFDPNGNGGLGSWSATDSMSIARYIHAATRLANGKVLVTGGLSPTGITASCELFDPYGNSGQGTWSVANPMNLARSNQTATLLPDGRVLVTGGQNSTYVPTSSCEIFDPDANGGIGSWTVTSSMSVGRLGHTATLLLNGKVLITGGGYANAELFDPAGSGTWSPAATMSNSRTYHTATILPGGKVLVSGGGSSSCELYDPNSGGPQGTWFPAASQAYQRSLHTMTTLLDGREFAIGGYDGTNSMSSCEMLDTVQSRVVRLPSRLATVEIIPHVPVVGQPFKVVVESQESGGQVQNVTLSTSFGLSLSTGTGILGGSLSGTIPKGDNRLVVSGITYSVAETGIVIQASVSSGDPLASGVSSGFMVAGVPSQVTLVSPQNGLSINTDSVRLVWRKSQFEIKRYWMELSTNSLFTGVAVDSTITDTTRTVLALQDNTTYWWRVRAWNQAGWGAFSLPGKFSTNIPPSRPQTLVVDGMSASALLSWRRSPENDLMRYYIYSGTTPGSLLLSDSTSGRNDTSKIISNLTNGQRYYFSVASIDSTRNLSARSLQVTTVPALFTIPTQLNIDSLKNGAIAWGDYDGDGFFDLVLSGEKDASRFSKVYRSTGTGRFEDINAAITGVRMGKLEWCDYNNDNKLDILFQGDNGPLTAPGVGRIYRNTGGNSFVDIGAGLTAVTAASIAQGDYNNDGRTDVIVAGWNGAVAVTNLFRQDSNGTFVKSNIVLPPMQNPSLSWADYDNDGDLDLLMIGGDATPSYSKLFRNDGPSADSSWIFTDTHSPFLGVNGGNTAAAWGDYDCDGDLDLVIVGYDPVARVSTAKIYRNDGGGTFVDIHASLTPVSSGWVAWGDYDGDGLLDLAFVGLSGGSVVSTICHNDGNGVFSSVSPGLAQAWGTVIWGDYDLDNDLDLLAGRLTVAGDPVPMLYRNNGATHNTPPSAPPNLQAFASGNSVRLVWGRASDRETPSAGLSYNLSVGTTKTGSDIVSPMADLFTGSRRVARLGNVDEDTSWVLKNLKPGRYYWTVQAIDNSFAGSRFASIDSFVIFGICIAQDPSSVPAKFFLAQNYPNPFNPLTTIQYGLPNRCSVKITVTNTLGQEVARFDNGDQDAGTHAVQWNAIVASGIYFCRMDAVSTFDPNNRFIQVKKMLLLK